MVDAWPLTLPQKLLRDGNSEAMGDGLLESQPDAGPSMTRRRTSAVMRPLNGFINCTAAQKATLKTFVETALLGGSLPFDFPDQDDPEETWLVKFQKGGLPSFNEIAAGLFRVAIKLNILP